MIILKRKFYFFIYIVPMSIVRSVFITLEIRCNVEGQILITF